MSTAPDPSSDGSSEYILKNSSGVTAKVRIQPGTSPRLQLLTAGFGFDIVNQAGDVVWSCEENGETIASPS